MRKTGILFITLLMLLTGSCKNEKAGKTLPAEAEKHKIVSLSGAITEIVSALGYEEQLVGVDVTSTFPESVKQTTKDLGHVYLLTIEPVMELQPNVILASDRDINPTLLQKMRESGVKTELLSQEFSLEGTKKLIVQVAEALNETDYQNLLDKIDADYARVQPFEKKPKVLFVYARGAGTLMVAGKNTPMQKMVELAGAEYVIDEFEDFKPLTPESLVQNNPDVILMFEAGLQSLGGVDGLLKIQGIAQTNAGKNKAVIAMDGGFLSGFGPRVGEAAAQLNELLRE